MRRLGLVMAFGLALAACSATTEVTVGTPSPTPTDPNATSSPVGTPTTPPTPKAQLAVYVLDGALWLYDVAADSVRQVTQQGEVRTPRFISRDQISFISDGVGGGRSGALMRLDLARSEITELFRVPTGIATYGWSPDRTTVAYVTVDDLDFPHIHFRTVSSGSIRTVSTLSRQFGRESVDDDQVRVAFSPDGERVLIVYTIAGGGGGDPTPDGSSFQVRTLDGSLAFAPDAAGAPTMGLWAPDGSAVYYRTNAGARMWPVEGGSVRSLPGTPVWFDPSASRNGRYIAFDTGASRPDVTVRLMDLRQSRIQALSQRGRAYPIFAANRIVWAQRVRRCTGDCLVPAEPVNEVVAIDIRDGTERPLAIRSLLDLDVLYA